jgi:hypothetical protein
MPAFVNRISGESCNGSANAPAAPDVSANAARQTELLITAWTACRSSSDQTIAPSPVANMSGLWNTLRFADS